MTCARGCCPDQRTHFRSVSMATRALVAGNRADEKCARDLVAYKSLVDQGYEPVRCTGAYELARDARSRHDIEGTHPIDEVLR